MGREKYKMKPTLSNISSILALLVLGSENARSYPQGYVEARYVDSESQGPNGTSGSSVYASLPESLSKTLDNGVKVLTEVSKDAQVTIDYLTGVALKMEGIFSGLIKSLSGGSQKSGGTKDTEMHARIPQLKKELEEDFESASQIKHWGIEKEAAYFLVDAKRVLLTLMQGKEFQGEKIEDINKGINEVLITLADETEDIQTKAKPVINAIEKVEKFINTPEVQAAAEGIINAAEAVAKFITPERPCEWDYGREKYVRIGHNKYWVDEGYLLCLNNRGQSCYNIKNKLRNWIGANGSNIDYYMRNDVWFLRHC